MNNTIAGVVGATLAALLWQGEGAHAQISVSSGLYMSGSCSSCDLSGREMTRLSLTGADFSKSNFSRSNLSGGEFNQSDLTGAQFSRAYLMRAKGERVNMHNAVLSDANLTEAALNRSNLSETDLRRADLSRGSFKGTDFSQSRFTSGIASGANFTDANFGLAKLHHTNFQSAIFIGATLKHTEFGTADVTDADFTAADFSGADLRQVFGLTQMQLNQGCGSPSTQIPQGIGLSVPYCKEYLQVASAAKTPVRIRSQRTIMFDGRDVSAQLDRLAATKAGLRENINTIDRAISALPPLGSQAAKAELEMSRAHLKRMYDGL